MPRTVHSAVLGEDRRILVVLPRNYEADATMRYPVLYKLDGDNQLQRYRDSIDVLNSIDAIPDLIVVAVPNARGQRNRDLTPPGLHQEEASSGQMGTGEMGNGDKFLEFIERELIPYVRGEFRSTDERILAGHSRAALLVLHSLLSKPDLFQARFLFSAPLTRDERRLLVETGKFLTEHKDHQSFVYFNWGESENEGMNQSYLAMKDLLVSKAPKRLRWTIERARRGDHRETPVIALPSALKEYFAGARPTGAGSTPANRTARVTSERSRRK